MKNIFIAISLVFLFFITPSLAQDGGIENLRQTGKAFASVARTVSPSVVFIRVEGNQAAPLHPEFFTPFGDNEFFNDELFKRFFGERFGDHFGNVPRQNKPKSQRKIIGQGSGFVYLSKNQFFSDKTYILTNNHVVESAEKILVTLKDGREFEAKVTGNDPKSDIAVLEIKMGGLPALSLGDSSKLEVGEWVVAIGNPFGLSHSLTVGVVSAKGRTSLGISDYEDFIQTDAAINPGNSGGPLVNLDNEVVGVNTAIFSRSGGYMGVGFAIPIDLVKNIANQLVSSGEVTRGYLGIVIQNLTPMLAESFDIDQKEGVLIDQVEEGSPAAKAGLKQGDVIITYEGNPVKNVGHFRNQVALSLPKSEKKIDIIRDGRRLNMTVKIGTSSEAKKDVESNDKNIEEIGLTVRTISPEMAAQYDVKQGQGVVVTKVDTGSIAAISGVQVGTVILQVNRNPVNSASEFTKALQNSSKDNRVLLLLKKDGVQHYLVLSW